MNYIKEQDAFERWLETNHLPTTAQLIWYKLFVLCNRAYWPEWFVVDNQRLMAMAKIPVTSEKTFIAHRNKLIEAGLIDHRRGKKGSPNKYRFKSFLKGEIGRISFLIEDDCTGFLPVQSKYTGKKPVDSTVQMTVHSTVQSTAIINKNKNKNKESDREAQSTEKGNIKLSATPTLGMVENYCKENASNINPKKFFYHYEAVGWMMGNSKMQNWQAAIERWSITENSKNTTQNKTNDSESASYNLSELESMISEGSVWD